MMAAAAVVAVSAASCSSSTSGKAAGPQTGDSSAAAGAAKVVVAGRPRQITGDVVCVLGPTGELNITVGATETTGPSPVTPPPLIADLTVSDGPAYVSLLAINLPDLTLSIGRYREVEQPKVTKEGKSYRITGQGAVGDVPDQRPNYQQFEVEVTCP
jgi:Mycobacterium 19 kDa lipoprotein antigen